MKFHYFICKILLVSSSILSTHFNSVYCS